MSEEKLRYTDEELEEFRLLIQEKLAKAKEDYATLLVALSHETDQETLDTSHTFNLMDEGTADLTKEASRRLAERQQKFIEHLEKALLRIEDKTYGICRETGKLIAKERLRAVPHATLSIEAKNRLND